MSDAQEWTDELDAKVADLTPIEEELLRLVRLRPWALDPPDRRFIIDLEIERREREIVIKDLAQRPK